MSGRPLHRAAIGAEAISALRGLLLPLVVIAFVGGGGVGRIVFYGIVGLVGSVVIASVTWATTRWQISDGAVRLRTGFLSERIVSIPLERVQSIDTLRGPVQRLFGVVELHLQAAGGTAGGEIVLKAVSLDEAEELRAAARGVLPAAAELSTDGSDGSSGGPNGSVTEEPVASLSLSRRSLVLAALTSGSLGVLVPVVAGLSQVLDDVIGAERAERLVPRSFGEAAVLAGGVLAAAWVLSFLGTIVAFAGFRATREGDRIRIERGIVERRAASVPVARIHAVRIVESPLREPFGLAQVRIESAGYAQEPATAQTLVPITRRKHAMRDVATLLPELATSIDGLASPPPRALRRYVLPPFALGLLVAAVPLAIFEADALVALALPVLGALLGVARYRTAGWRLDGTLVVRKRRLMRTTAVADARRLQRVTGAQSVLQRRAALADVEVAVSSGRRLGVEHLDAATVDDLVGRLATSARR